MRRHPVLLAVLATAVAGVHATDHTSLGYSDETVTIGPGPDACAGGVLIHNHDGSFENGYAWHYGGTRPPYFGAFAEGCDLGPGIIHCGAYWLTQTGTFNGQTADCYIWEGGTDTAPGAVLGIVSGVLFDNIPYWPAIGQNDVEMNIAVTGAFTVGLWGDWEHTLHGFYCAADLDGNRGHPWTCITPGIGYPTGWQDPSIIWGPTSSMGCGVYFEQGTPAENPTWGGLKALFR